jgi:hypothetical protein
LHAIHERNLLPNQMLSILSDGRKLDKRDAVK